MRSCLELAAPLVVATELNRESIAARLELGHLDATTLMEHMIRRGTPQRKAHDLVGNLVRKALTRSLRLSDLPLADFQEADPGLDESVYMVLGAKNAVRAFVSYGSTAPEQVKHQLAAWRKRLD